ncbi:signal peptidase I [Aurantivibrio infirmus]
MKIKKVLHRNRGFIAFLLLMFVVRGAVADWYHVPTGSMKPTILEGDYVFVNKLAYDLHPPFSTHSVLRLSDPKPGDVIVFESAVADIRLIKRVVGVPGDVISMRNNQLIVNGKPLPYERVDVEDLHPELNKSSDKLTFRETISGQSHLLQTDAHLTSPYGSFSEIVVPQESYFVLGDNRDNSRDSRFIGFVSRGEIVGRSRKILLSLNYDNYYLPRLDRINFPLL